MEEHECGVCEVCEGGRGWGGGRVDEDVGERWRLEGEAALGRECRGGFGGGGGEGSGESGGQGCAGGRWEGVGGAEWGA